MRYRETVTAAAVVLATLSEPSLAGSAGMYELPIGTETEISHYNKCEKIEPGKWECTTCVESEIRQQSICTREITNNPSPTNP